MRKFFYAFFLVAMALCANVAKADTVIFDGSEDADWGKRISLSADWASVQPGTQMEVTATIKNNEAEQYASFHLIDASWVKIVDSVSLPYEPNTDQTVTVELTSDILTAAVNGGGMGVQGYNFTLKKVVLKDGKEQTAGPEDLEPVVLWNGEQTIDGWGASSLVFDVQNDAFATFCQNITKACNLYVLVEKAAGANIRISGQWGGWGETAFPADGYDHKADADGVVKLQLTDEFVTKAFKEQGGFAIWGNGGFVVKTIATTKEAALNAATGINTVESASSVNAKAYNLNGQRINSDAKGIVIVNGKKFFNR